MYACALGFVGALAATLEFHGHLAAALVVGVVYGVLYLQSHVIIIRYGLKIR